ncbi:MAG: hypothetical protein J2P13_09585 [Acidobacteria bacterium]|nr:hypothetical protein [Acidobacteriota bacterium]
MANVRQRNPRGQEQRETEERRKREEESLDRTLEDSFPASDPPSTIPNPEDEDENAA